MADMISFTPPYAAGPYGTRVPGALAWFYAAGTMTPRTVFADVQMTTPLVQPVEADAYGVFPPVFVNGGGAVKVIARDPFTDMMLPGFPMDPAFVVSAEGGGAANIGFTPTAEIPRTTVQDAIERVQENITAPLAAFGLGVTGNAPLLADLDATNTASGMYRYDVDTAGSYPAGVVPATGGVVTLWRRGANDATMQLYTTNVIGIWTRRLTAGNWSGWQQLYRAAATQAQAEAGTNDANTMTPARTADAIAARAVGIGQTWQDLTGSRSTSTSYQNTTGRPITVNVAGVQGTSDNGRAFQVSSDNSSWITVGRVGANNNVHSGCSVIVPAGWYYRLNGSMVGFSWAELR